MTHPNTKSPDAAGVAKEDQWVAQVVSSGPWANLPLLEWRNADVSLCQPIGTKLYTSASAINAELLDALQSFIYEFGDKTNSATVNKARAAIKRATA